MQFQTLVIQSHTQPLPLAWLQRCLDSVESWAKLNTYDYRFLDDEIFTLIPEKLMEKLEHRKVIASDLARLYAIQKALQQGYKTVLWIDADFYIFNPEGFVLPESDFAVGREVWVQQDEQGRLKTYKKVHNAFLMFRQKNALLEFYLQTASRLIQQNTGEMPSQFIGPKLLTALHNICQFPVMENAGMLSPLVLKDILAGQGSALNMFIQQSPVPIAGANLCSSLTQSTAISSQNIFNIMDFLDRNILD
jgi:hypothetical protein